MKKLNKEKIDKHRIIFIIATLIIATIATIIIIPAAIIKYLITFIVKGFKLLVGKGK